MYDNFSKFLADEYPQDFASWLLGEPIAFTELPSKELSTEPIRADSVILLQSSQIIAHIEFQTDPDPDMSYRMADYALRIYRKFPGRRLVQVVVYLRETTSEKVFQTEFRENNTAHEFRVIRIWEESTEPFLRSPGLLPYAALTQTDDREGVLREVSRRIDEMENLRERNNLVAISAVIGALSLNKEVIQRILRRDIMQASPMYQEMQSWAKADAERDLRITVEELRITMEEELRITVEEELRITVEDEIRESVISQNTRSIALNMLHKSFPLDTIAELTGLTIAQLQELQPDRIA